MPDDKDFDQYLEKRAEQLGLPTDPEAYQDGGLAVAATARNLAEAEALAMYLNSRGIPAWVDSPLSAIYSVGYIRPAVAVRVPLGRLADAQELLAQHEGKAPDPEGAEEPPAESDSEAEEAPEVALEAERPQLRPLPRTLVGIFLLTVSVGYLAMAAMGAFLPPGHASATERVIGVLAPAVLGVGCCIIGMRALRRPREGS